MISRLSYDREHDACGIGAVVKIDGIPEHSVMDDALSIVEKLEHRAGKDASGTVGDGVGIMLQISHAFFSFAAKEAGIELGAPGLMKSYEELINSIEALRKDTEEDYQGRKPITASEFDDACEALRECAMSFDLESVDNIIGEIRKYSLNETDAAFITEISRSSMAADSDGIVKKIDERMNRSK